MNKKQFPTEVGRIFVAGDTHGNKKWWRTLIKLANQHDCKVIVQVGDFGFWPEQNSGSITDSTGIDMQYLTFIAELLRDTDTRLVVIDGNHDDHPRARAAFDIMFSNVREVIEGTIFWADRGSRWIWNNVQFGALGGAVSVDRFNPTRPRTEGIDWWATERLTQEEVDFYGNEPVDVLFTHDAPLGVERTKGEITNVILKTEIAEHRGFLASAINATSPEIVIHGHYHSRYDDIYYIPFGNEVRVAGLAHDDQHDSQGASELSWGILDTQDLSFVDGHGAEAQLIT